MKKFIYSFVANVFFIIVIAAIVITVTTISLTKKINDYRTQYQQGVTATVQKDDVPILALNRGIIKNVYFSEGQKVKKGQLLAEITNPVLEQQIKTLAQYPDNVSAKTQADVAKSQLQYNKIYAPIDGVVGTVNTTENSPVDEYSKVMDIFSDSNVKLLVYLSPDQYLVAEKMTKIPAYDLRLDQNFDTSPQQLKPDQNDPNKKDAGSTQNKIALYLKLNNPADASSLLNGESLELRLESSGDNVSKPIDLFVNFWNGLIK